MTPVGRYYSPSGCSVHGILQARKLEWLPFLSPGDLPNPGIEPGSAALQADSFPSEPLGERVADGRTRVGWRTGKNPLEGGAEASSIRSCSQALQF